MFSNFPHSNTILVINSILNKHWNCKIISNYETKKLLPSFLVQLEPAINKLNLLIRFDDIHDILLKLSTNKALWKPFIILSIFDVQQTFELCNKLFPWVASFFVCSNFVNICFTPRKFEAEKHTATFHLVNYYDYSKGYFF